MGLFTKECAVCGRESLGINCASLEGGLYLCASCDRTVRLYVKKVTSRRFAPPARVFDLVTLKAIVADENPPITLPGDDAVDDAFMSTGAVGTFARYNDRTRELLICPVRDVTGMEVHEGGEVVSYDSIGGLEILDDGSCVLPGARGRSSSLVLRLHLKDGSQRDVRALCTPQNRKGFAYTHTLEQLRFLARHIEEMRL